ncbi:flagellar export protein FliJ [Sutcliffiella rhizosphaerae]|uniref:Flagellar FliJ protein n=1 Tax=Sutcliffiella rhizosphaerae TaxID=2880967 RepID=A0ABN8A3Y0_9BACI|nr:flagellar export protein FliJ [Sutcliffiella rhizosphaerae]CAG9619709.1 Flagellar FliJ protein [Sutcliffiella rhizosphaerae]
MLLKRGRLEKILVVKNAEKNQASSEYRQAISNFESEGKALYELLKKKELLEEHLQTQLQTGIPIEKLKQQQFFMGNLEKNLFHQQKKVNHARAFMNLKEEKLKEQSVEFKKYEVLEEKEKRYWKEIDSKTEATFIDELSILQYSQHTNR